MYKEGQLLVAGISFRHATPLPSAVFLKIFHNFIEQKDLQHLLDYVIHVIYCFIHHIAVLAK